MVQTRYEYTTVSFSEALDQRLLQEFAGIAELPDLRRLQEDSLRRHDGLRLRRAFLKAMARPLGPLRLELLLDFASLADGDEPRHLVKAFFGEVAIGKRVAVNFGLFKIPFSLAEMVSAARLELAEKGTTHEFLKYLGLAGRDIGVMVSAAPLPRKRWLRVHLGAFQGDAIGAQSSPAPGLLAARVVSRPWSPLRLGAGVSWRPRTVITWWDYYRFHNANLVSGKAVGADAALVVGRFAARGEVVTGDRTDVDLPDFGRIRRGDGRTFLSSWGIASYQVPIRSVILMPAVRFEWLDVDREHATGRIVTAGAAMTAILTPALRLLVDVSHNDVQPGTRDWEVLLVRYLPSFTRTTLQAQLRL
jgi:hypothetical protein